jgi:hypothetical protein
LVLLKSEPISAFSDSQQTTPLQLCPQHQKQCASPKLTMSGNSAEALAQAFVKNTEVLVQKVSIPCCISAKILVSDGCA